MKLLVNVFEGGFNSRIVGNGATGERGLTGGVFISLVSSSGSVFETGEFFFSIAVVVVVVVLSRWLSDNGLIFLPIRASNDEFDGAAAVVVAVAGAAVEDDDDVDTSIESGDKVPVDGWGFSMLDIGNSFGFSRGINISTMDGGTSVSSSI